MIFCAPPGENTFKAESPLVLICKLSLEALKLLICTACGGGSIPCGDEKESLFPLNKKAGVGEVTSNWTGIVIEPFRPDELIVIEPL